MRTIERLSGTREGNARDGGSAGGTRPPAARPPAEELADQQLADQELADQGLTGLARLLAVPFVPLIALCEALTALYHCSVSAARWLWSRVRRPLRFVVNALVWLFRRATPLLRIAAHAVRWVAVRVWTGLDRLFRAIDFLVVGLALGVRAAARLLTVLASAGWRGAVSVARAVRSAPRAIGHALAVLLGGLRRVVEPLVRLWVAALRAAVTGLGPPLRAASRLLRSVVDQLRVGAELVRLAVVAWADAAGWAWVALEGRVLAIARGGLRLLAAGVRRTWATAGRAVAAVLRLLAGPVAGALVIARRVRAALASGAMASARALARLGRALGRALGTGWRRCAPPLRWARRQLVRVGWRLAAVTARALRGVAVGWRRAALAVRRARLGALQQARAVSRRLRAVTRQVRLSRRVR